MTSAEPSDEALAARARDGDRRAFELLVSRFKAPLYRFIRRYVGSSDDAYDLLQDTFISAWGALGRYDSGRAFPAWLRTIALNKCRDFGRRRSARQAMHDLFARERDNAVAEDGDDAEDMRHAHLDAAIAALPAKYKEPLLLTALEGLSHQEAAEVLRITSKAVEMRLYRARRLLAEHMGEPEP